MKELPKVNESFGELYRMLIAPIRLKLLLTGIELKVLDQGEIAGAMLRAGFMSVRSHTVDTPMGLMDLDIGRKAEG